jgi:DNA-binding transcriptional ArsR family regulator
MLKADDMVQRRRATARSSGPYRMITGARALELLASPLRQEILDTISAFGGEAAAGDLAEHLGRPVDGLYYHLRLLVKGGLVAEVPNRNPAGRLERRYRIAVPGRGPLRLAYQPKVRRNAEALRRLAGGMLRIAGRDFQAAIADPEVTVEGPLRELWAGRAKGWLSDVELAEVNQMLARLARLLDQPRTTQRRRLVSLCFVLAPVEARPKRRVAERRARAVRRTARATGRRPSRPRRRARRLRPGGSLAPRA